jgi:hypothetical protein
MTHGGKRSNAGRPRLYPKDEKRVQVRIPERLVPAFREWLKRKEAKIRLK